MLRFLAILLVLPLVCHLEAKRRWRCLRPGRRSPPPRRVGVLVVDPSRLEQRQRLASLHLAARYSTGREREELMIAAAAG